MRAIPGVAAVFIIAASGFTYGTWTGRWSHSRALENAVTRLSAVPTSFGDWESQAAKLDPRDLEAAGVAGHFARQFVNRRTGAAVTVLLLCGRPGPIAVHRPEVCYGGVGYELIGDREQVRLADSDEKTATGDTVWAINMEKPGAADPGRLRILYAWSNDGTWKASIRPRLEFAGSDALFKLYVVRPAGHSRQPDEDDSGVLFLRQFLPRLRESLFVHPAD